MRSMADGMWAGMLCLACLTPVAGAQPNGPAALSWEFASRAPESSSYFNWELTGALDPHGRPVPPRTGTMQLLAFQEPAGWKVVAAQNTSAAAAR